MWSNHRRPVCLALLVGLISFSLAACSSSSRAAHVTTIAIISSSSAFDPVVPGFKAAMASASFVEGQSIEYVYHGVINSDAATVDQEIQALASHNPDLYLILGTVPALRIKDVLTKTNKPGVFAPVINPEKLGLVLDLRKPGGLMTGINTGGPFTTRAFEWYLTVASAVKRVHVFYLHGESQAPT